MKENKEGFTLLELLVVVLIIGILASIALPQYKMAVTKAKVASILPLMRRWKDALAEYKLQHGDYDVDSGSGSVDASWPSDWKLANNPCGDSFGCQNDYWDCMANDEHLGHVYCQRNTSDGGYFDIIMYPTDYDNEDYRGKIVCRYEDSDEGKKVCKAIGSTVIYVNDDYGEYAL